MLSAPVAAAAGPTPTHARPDHLELTAAQPRDDTLAWATVQAVNRCTPTVVGLELEVEDPAGFTFAAGQWVDFHIPTVSVIGGYSITSVPSQLPVLELAVKASPGGYPPAAWVTEQCRPGDRVQLRVGGDFVLPPPPPAAAARGRRLLFIAGGVGINPLYGMIRQVVAEASAAGPEAAAAKVALLYSAETRAELVFEHELSAMAGAAGGVQFRPYYTTTQEKQHPAANTSAGAGALPAAGTGRVSHELIGEALAWLADGDVPARPGPSPSSPSAVDAVFVCGPPGMPEAMADACALHDLPRSAVKWEQWW